jgi:hypothetical protein
MATTYGVRLALKGVLIGATHARSTILGVFRTYQTEVRIGVKVASIKVPTGVMIAMNTMQTGAIDVQRILTVEVIVLSMTIPTDLMLSSTVPTKRNACSLG